MPLSQLQEQRLKRGRPGLVDYMKDLAERCEALGVTGLEKLNNTGLDPETLETLLSEARVAYLFARFGAKAAILGDQAFGREWYTPDILVQLPKLELLVEVRQATQSVPEINTLVEEVIKQHGLPFRVEYRVGPELSAPVFDRASRVRIHERAAEVVKQVAHELRSALPRSAGEIAVGEHRFLYEPSPVGDGYAASGVRGACGVDDVENAAKLRRELQRKAEKRAALPEHLRARPFIVAYDTLESAPIQYALARALTGGYGPVKDAKPAVNLPSPRTPEWQESWQRLLMRWQLDPDAQLPFQHGAFLTEPWAQHLSGVLVTHRGGLVQWLPNPFAAEEIREPRLLDIGLPLDKNGARIGQAYSFGQWPPEEIESATRTFALLSAQEAAKDGGRVASDRRERGP